MHRYPPGPRAPNSEPVTTKSGTMLENGDLAIGRIVGVARSTMSFIPSSEFPVSIKARRGPAWGARERAPVRVASKWHSSGERKRRQYKTGYIVIIVVTFSWKTPLQSRYLMQGVCRYPT